MKASSHLKSPFLLPVCPIDFLILTNPYEPTPEWDLTFPMPLPKRSKDATTDRQPLQPHPSPELPDAAEETGILSRESSPELPDAAKETGILSRESSPELPDAAKEAGNLSPESLPESPDAAKEAGNSSPESLPESPDATEEAGISSPESLPESPDAAKETGISSPESSPESLPESPDATEEAGISSSESQDESQDAAKEAGISSPVSSPELPDATEEAGISSRDSSPKLPDAAEEAGISSRDALPETQDESQEAAEEAVEGSRDPSPEWYVHLDDRYPVSPSAFIELPKILPLPKWDPSPGSSSSDEETPTVSPRSSCEGPVLSPLPGLERVSPTSPTVECPVVSPIVEQPEKGDKVRDDRPGVTSTQSNVPVPTPDRPADSLSLERVPTTDGKALAQGKAEEDARQHAVAQDAVGDPLKQVRFKRCPPPKSLSNGNQPSVASKKVQKKKRSRPPKKSKHLTKEASNTHESNPWDTSPGKPRDSSGSHHVHPVQPTSHSKTGSSSVSEEASKKIPFIQLDPSQSPFTSQAECCIVSEKGMSPFVSKRKLAKPFKRVPTEAYLPYVRIYLNSTQRQCHPLPPVASGTHSKNLQKREATQRISRNPVKGPEGIQVYDLTMDSDDEDRIMIDLTEL